MFWKNKKRELFLETLLSPIPRLPPNHGHISFYLFYSYYAMDIVLSALHSYRSP